MNVTRAINLIFDFTLVMLGCLKMRIILLILVPIDAVLRDNRFRPVLSQVMLLREVVVSLVVASNVLVSESLDVLNAVDRILYIL